MYVRLCSAILVLRYLCNLGLNKGVQLEAAVRWVNDACLLEDAENDVTMFRGRRIGNTYLSVSNITLLGMTEASCGYFTVFSHAFYQIVLVHMIETMRVITSISDLAYPKLSSIN